LSQEDQSLPELPADLSRSLEAPGKDASTELSKHRTRLSEHRTDLSEKRTGLSEHRTDLSNLRSHLSNERTHLSYLRTSISLLGFGITLNRFSIYLQEKKDLADRPHWALRDTERVGTGMVLLGVLLLVYSLWRFRALSVAIDSGKYEPRQRVMTMLTLAIILMGGLSAIWLLWLSRTR
jgi:putative membrane protein